jgi:hypothetical protein
MGLTESLNGKIEVCKEFMWRNFPKVATWRTMYEMDIRKIDCVVINWL